MNIYSVPATGTSNKSASSQTSQSGSLTICPSQTEVSPFGAKASLSSESTSRLVLGSTVVVHYIHVNIHEQPQAAVSLTICI